MPTLSAIAAISLLGESLIFLVRVCGLHAGLVWVSRTVTGSVHGGGVVVRVSESLRDQLVRRAREYGVRWR